jgi:hypothetical protein
VIEGGDVEEITPILKYRSITNQSTNQKSINQKQNSTINNSKFVQLSEGSVVEGGNVKEITPILKYQSITNQSTNQSIKDKILLSKLANLSSCLKALW